MILQKRKSVAIDEEGRLVMQIDVVRNGKKNLAEGFVNRMVLLLCPFVERTVIYYILGVQYLGLGSLFSAIISVLSVTELGISSAVVYSMYKPAAEGDTRKLNGLLSYYKKAYRLVGFCILGAGLLVIPFLRRLINGPYPEEINLTALYVIYVLNSCASYFLFSYIDAVLVVHQRNDISSSVNTIVRLLLLGCQIAVLVLTKNYYYFALLIPVFTVINNIWVALRVRRIYPQYRAEGKLSEETRTEIRRSIAGIFVQKLCGITRNSLDSICISAFIGLTLTAAYNNYFVIFTGIASFVGIISSSFLGGVGNHVATRSVEENYEEMKKMDFVYLWVGGWCTVCLLCLFQPFMELWMGKELLLPFPAVCLLCLYFYLLRLGDIRFLYSTAKGLWWEQRYQATVETIMNLALNIILGKLFGIYGIIAATIISLFLCNYLWSAGITFRHYFSIGRRKDYYLYQGKHSALVLAAGLITYGLCETIRVDDLFFRLLMRGSICMIIPNCLFYIMYRKSNGFLYAKEKIIGERSKQEKGMKNRPMG